MLLALSYNELSEAFENTSAALSERDDITQGLIDSESESDESDDDEEEAYWAGWGNSRRHDEDNEPGAGRATGGGGGGACCYGYSSSSEKKTSSSSAPSPRSTGATACWRWSSNHFVAVALALVAGLQWVTGYIPFKVSSKHYCTNMLSSPISLILVGFS